MWRDGAVLDLGFEREFTRDRKVESNAVDVIESGLVAVVQIVMRTLRGSRRPHGFGTTVRRRGSLWAELGRSRWCPR